MKNKVFLAGWLMLWLMPFWGFGQSQNLFEISKNLDIFSNLYKQLDLNYVDEVKPGELMKTGIEAMLESLDPYTNYIPESDIEDYRFMTTGQYGGVGALVQKKGDYIIIAEPYKGFAADRAGLIAGDRVIEINGNDVKKKTVDDVSNYLKGQPGSIIKLKIDREGDKVFEVSLTRENIQIENIPYYGMLNDHIGYIKLNSFTQTSSKEVKEAFMKLREGGNLKGLIFDLRGNGGGLLNEAVNIANIFVDKDQLIVSTKGRLASANNSYKTALPAVDKDIPLTFLVDKNSASASEILAGSMQDLDRAVIIGQRSFGKGLVQNVLPLSYNSQVKVTVAKYYIPSGRCIQAIDYSHKDAEGNFGHIPDSLITAFKTKNNRKVFDGGGIEPDVVLEPEKYSNIAISLLSKYLVFDYCTKFKKEHASIAAPKDFVVTDEVFNDFIQFLKGKSYDDYASLAERNLDEFKKNAIKEKFFDDIKPDYEAFLKKIEDNKKNDLQKNKEEIKTLLRDEIVTRYYYQKGRIESSLAGDPEVTKAKEVLDNKIMYSSILAGTLKKSETSNSK